MDTIRNEIFAPDIVWNLPGRHPLSGTKHGAEEVLARQQRPAIAAETKRQRPGFLCEADQAIEVTLDSWTVD